MTTSGHDSTHLDSIHPDTIHSGPTRFALSRRRVFGLAGAGAAAALLSACGDDDGGSSGSTKKQTFEFWNIGTNEPMKTYWPQLAKAFETKTGNTVKVTTMENEAFKSKLTTVTQAGNPPDLFHSWGGGVLRQQHDAGLIKDLSGESWLNTISKTGLNPFQIDGKTYAIPYDMGMVTFWYNKDLFAQAGVTATPATWKDFLGVVSKLKAAGITPIALAGADKWPAHFYWSYLAMRLGGSALFRNAVKDKNFNKPEFLQASAHLADLVKLDPFQKGFAAAKYDAPGGQSATMGNGLAAIELMGQWGPPVEASTSTSKKGIGDKLGWFPFPTIDGAPGKTTDAFGGGDGYAVGKNAPRAAIDFLKYICEIDNQRAFAKSGAGLPTVTGAEDAISDPNLVAVAKLLGTATDFQLYLDQAFAPAVGQQVNDSVAELVLGKATPEQVSKAVTEAVSR